MAAAEISPMSLDRKSLASFRVLVAVARADGKLEDEERDALKGALGAQSDLLDSLLLEETVIDDELALLDEPGRKRLYQSAFALAYADGHASVDEVNLLKRIVPNSGERTLLGQVFGEAADTFVPGRIVAEADPVKRDHEILEDIGKYSVLAAVAGAMPVPGLGIVADVAVIALQAKMVHDIGQYWGHQLDLHAVRAFMGSVVGSTGMRIAVNNLARFVPGWGSAFGAATSFATTFALGKVAERWFASGRELDQGELRSLFEGARFEAGERFTTEERNIESARAVHAETLATLNEKLAHGELTRAAYDAEIAKLT
jgi:uncharacterized protein (DUF697 family)